MSLTVLQFNIYPLKAVLHTVLHCGVTLKIKGTTKILSSSVSHLNQRMRLFFSEQGSNTTHVTIACNTLARWCLLFNILQSEIYFFVLGTYVSEKLTLPNFPYVAQILIYLQYTEVSVFSFDAFRFTQNSLYDSNSQLFTILYCLYTQCNVLTIFKIF